MQNGLPRILIIRLSAIGDVVRVIPALHCIREVFPNAQIDWVVESKSAEVLRSSPVLDNIILFERSDEFIPSLKEFFTTAKQIRANRYDYVVDFHGIFKSGVFARYSGSPARIGFERPRSQELSYLATNKKVKLGPEIVNRMHENLALCDAFYKGPKSLDVALAVPEEDIMLMEHFFEDQFHGAKTIVAIHVPVERPEKQWPIQYFSEVIDMLLSDGRFDVVLTWGPGQREIVEQVSQTCKRDPVISPQLSTLRQYMALIQCADMYLGGDTGPMHIASALDVAVVALFAGTNPAQHSPLREPLEVLSEYPSGETRQKLPETLASELMLKISPEMVFDACVRLVKRSRSV
jgi:3-deoxy-D-manno-octulosonic-acid transferase/heptosyltransferase-1